MDTSQSCTLKLSPSSVILLLLMIELSKRDFVSLQSEFVGLFTHKRQSRWVPEYKFIVDLLNNVLNNPAPTHKRYQSKLSSQTSCQVLETWAQICLEVINIVRYVKKFQQVNMQ
uniref:Uncharacterized protein n=1 Tax=Schistosoma curassoni TaxID=6186 RepID=A0A183KVD0_9TREM